MDVPSVAPTLEAIHITTEAGQPMRQVSEIQAIAKVGLEGDRYARGEGYYSPHDDVCEVTLIEGEVLDDIEKAEDIHVLQGQHRRNLVTRGLRLRELDGYRLQIGEVVLEYDRPRPPCAYVERLTQKGMTKALGRGAGIGVRVVVGGILRAGAGIEVSPIPGQTSRRQLP